MALTKPNFYIGALGISIMIFLGLLIAGNDLVNNGVNLDNDSLSYINQYSGYIDNSNISQFDDNNKNYVSTSLTQDQAGSGDIVTTDVFATLNFWRNSVNKIENYLKLVYNLPTLFVQTLGLPVGEFNHYINVMGIILFISLIILVIRLVRGS